jgi:hypothetical protein
MANGRKTRPPAEPRPTLAQRRAKAEADKKYTFEDMEAEKSNVQDIDEYLNFADTLTRSIQDAVDQTAARTDLESRLAAYQNPSYDRLGQLRGRGMSLGDAKSYLAAEQAAQAAGARRQQELPTTIQGPAGSRPPALSQPSGRNAGADAASYAAYLAAQQAAGPPISQRTPPTTTRGGSGRLTTQQQAAKTAESVKETSATAQQAIADAYAAMEAAKTGNTAANVIANMSADDQMRMILAQNANAEAAAASEALRLANEEARLGQGNVDEALLAALAAGGDLGMGGPTGVTTTTGPATTTAAGDTAAIADTALTTAAKAVASGDPFAAADAAGTDIRGRDLSYLQDPELNLDFLTLWDTAIKETLGDTSGMTAVEAAEAYETASAQKALDEEIINQDVFNALEIQIATDEGGNINAPIFQWGVNPDTGADQIVLAPVEEQIVVPDGGDGDGDEGGGDDPPIVVPPEDQLTYEQKQKNISTNTYNDRIEYIQAAVKAGQMDLDTAQTEFNTAKNQLFAQMAALNEATYGTVADEFQARTTQRAADVEAMLKYLTDPVEDPDPVGFGQESDFQAGAGIDRDFIQQIIGDDIAWNMAGYAEETDAMRDFMGALELIGQQGASEAEMLGNYMFDSYRQDLDTTGRNMELQAAMQMLAEQQAAAEQNLQSSMLGPYFGIDPALMMAGMGAGVDVAGVSENRAIREQAAEDAMAMLLAQQAFQTGEREAGQRFQTGERLGAQQFAGGQSYQDNVWDYLTGQTMTPYQSGMLGVAQQGQEIDTLSTLMDLMNPQPTTAQTTAMAAQAQTAALDSALSKMRVGNIPAQDPIFKQGQMMAGTPAFNWKNNLTGEEIQALDAVGWDTEDLLYGDMQEQINSMNEISNMGSFADVMQVPLEVLMGAQALGAGVVGALVDDIIAGGNDPLVNYTHPAMEGFEPWTESIPLSQATALYDYEYQAGEPVPFNLFGYDVGEDGLLDTDRVMDLMELGYTQEEIEEALLGL